MIKVKYCNHIYRPSCRSNWTNWRSRDLWSKIWSRL